MNTPVDRCVDQLLAAGAVVRADGWWLGKHRLGATVPAVANLRGALKLKDYLRTHQGRRFSRPIEKIVID